MRIFLILLAAFGALFIVLASSGVYPVAAVDGSPIFARTWKKAEEAAKNFVNTQARAAGQKVIDFSRPENAELSLAVKRDTLTFLIEDLILQQEGKELSDALPGLARDRVLQALAGSGNIEEAARLTYGLSLAEFRELVLLPQARRDVAKEILGEKGLDFEPWFGEIKRKKKVRLMFVPFSWNGEIIQ